MQPRFNGILKEIQNQNSAELAVLLEDKLQIPPDKAEELVTRIKKHQIKRSEPQETTLPILEKPNKNTNTKQCSYPMDNLSAKEFSYFIKWLLPELGYAVESELRVTEWGFDVDSG